MAAAKSYTKAEEYRRIIAEKQKAEQFYDVTCECSMTWEARRMPLEFWVTSGVLPAHLAAVFVKATEKIGADPQKLMKSMAASEVLQSIEFSSKVVKHTAVNPRIVEVVRDPATEWAQEDTMTCCYNTLLKWQLSGGDEAAGLETFPSK